MEELKKDHGSNFRKKFHQSLRRMFGRLPTSIRFRLYRALIDCDPAPDLRLELKIAETQEELTDCFKLLHDAYVASGFMKPDPSGMRITIYHALPTTTTLCAKYDGKIVGTISMIREGVFGFPLQSVFDLEQVRAKGGNIAEISALAVHPDFRKTGGVILFPLMKFMHQYCTEFFDVRHLVIAVNPDKIELYEALLYFLRLRETVVANYDFANGAPAVGASLDLSTAADTFREGYRGKAIRKNLYKYFFELKLKNIKIPYRRYFTTNDPVMTPRLLDIFFNKKSKVFETMDDRKKSLLWSIYDHAEYRAVLPLLAGPDVGSHPLRRHQRYSIRCPGHVVIKTNGDARTFGVEVIEISLAGFQAECQIDMPLSADAEAIISLGEQDTAHIPAIVMRRKETDSGVFFGFKVEEPDAVWRACVAALEVGHTSSDLLQ